MTRHAYRQAGFSLIELVIAVAIVGILAAIAYPSYQEQVRKGKRTDATSGLLQLAQRLERCYTQYNSYTHANCPATPVISPEGEYSIAIARTQTTFTLTATPVAGGSQQGDDKCATYTYSHTGQKLAYKTGALNAANLHTDYCW